MEGHEFKQTWRKANWNVSSGLKQLKVAKEKLKEKKKHKNVKLKENVPGAMLPREKPEECTMCYRSSNSNKRFEANVHILAGYVLPFVFYKMPDQASSHLTKFQSQRDVVISHIPHTYSKEMASKSQTVSISNASSPLLFLDCGSVAKIFITQYPQLRRLLPHGKITNWRHMAGVLHIPV